MEHYEVEDMFGKRRKPRLTLLCDLKDISIGNGSYKFTLQFYLANRGKAIAKYVAFTASFFNVSIISTTGHFERLDSLRGIPSIQYNMILGVIHPHPISRVYIGEISFSVKDGNQPIRMEYEIEAEDMMPIEGKLNLSVQDLITMKSYIDKGAKFTLTPEEQVLTFP